MDKIIRLEGINLIDFILNYKGSIEDYLFPFIMEQGYTEIADYYTSDKIIKTTRNTNNTTNIPIEKSDVISTDTNSTFDIPPHSFNTSFSIAFDA